MTNPIDEYGQKYIDSHPKTDNREAMLAKAEKQVKNAKIYLILIGVLTIGVAVALYFVGGQVNLWAYLIDMFIGLIFIGLAVWVNKKPRVAVLTGLVAYIALFIITVAIEPSSISGGWIFRILIILGLWNGYKSAKQAEELRHELGRLDAEKDGEVPFGYGELN